MWVCFRSCGWETVDVFHFVFMVAQFTNCAIRSEADVTPAWRNQAFVSSSRLLGVACVISVANMFPFLQFPLSFNNWKCLDALWLYKKKHDFTFIETRFDNKLGITPTFSTSGEQRGPLESHLFFKYVLKKPCFSLAEMLFACISASLMWNMLLWQ